MARSSGAEPGSPGAAWRARASAMAASVVLAASSIDEYGRSIRSSIPTMTAPAKLRSSCNARTTSAVPTSPRAIAATWFTRSASSPAASTSPLAASAPPTRPAPAAIATTSTTAGAVSERRGGAAMAIIGAGRDSRLRSAGEGRIPRHRGGCRRDRHHVVAVVVHAPRVVPVLAARVVPVLAAGVVPVLALVHADVTVEPADADAPEPVAARVVDDPDVHHQRCRRRVRARGAARHVGIRDAPEPSARVVDAQLGMAVPTRQPGDVLGDVVHVDGRVEHEHGRDQMPL